MVSVILVLFGYLLGSIPFAYIAGRMFKGIDIRKIGDENVGAANAYREISPTAGIGVLLADASKGVIAIIVAQAFASPHTPSAPGSGSMQGDMIRPINPSIIPSSCPARAAPKKRA